MSNLANSAIRQYMVVTGNYWAFTLTDGALRMLVVLHFHQLGYGALSIALLFLFYEFFGVVTNLFGGWLGARIGLNKTMNIGLSLQIIALLMLTLPTDYLSMAWVMAAQALSGIAKDLNKMSAKSAIKSLVDESAQSTLFKWVAILTGSKNALKGVGFFLGGALLHFVGFQGAMWIMLVGLIIILSCSLILLKKSLGVSKSKPKFTEVFSKNRAINILSAARMFLFASRDIWFVVALPVYLSETIGWDFWIVGSVMAGWVIMYGFIQSIAPSITGKKSKTPPNGRSAAIWAGILCFIPTLFALSLGGKEIWILLVGLGIFGAVFALNSSLHSYLIVSYARKDGTSLDVGFYYMANAMGRLIGTMLSGAVFQLWGLEACLYFSSLMLMITAIISLWLPKEIPVSA
ncbi:organoarsenical effux MFS transporter ArsJ [Neptuniibacter sp. QD34_54]|uniref:organoarsenical effux MFS transporter ArsJ n=1 Tax=Neptuniibacter sp. QD34_54 TaxID=3398208 RepID=UPI0039F59611